MALRSTYISIFSLFLINSSQAQTGDGCFLKTCSTPGQVRIDAEFDGHGRFVAGCNCACPPGLTDPHSPLFCEEPNTINFNPHTLVGDCSCQCPAASTSTPPTCRWPQIYNPAQCGCACPAFAPDPSSCVAPQEFNTALCQCACEIGSVGGPCISNGQPVRDSMVLQDCTCNVINVNCQGNQQPNAVTGACECPIQTQSGLFLPTCHPPLSKDPVTCDCVTTTTTIPPAGPIEVSCSSAGACSCPFGTKGPCTINCEQGNDACKDGLIECNNEGFDCFVNCRSGAACAGGAHIVGPVNGALNVNCIGSGSCEGAVIFDNEHGTDTNVICDGAQSCKGNVHWIFGPGAGRLECNGVSGGDTCSGAAAFTLIHNAETTPGCSFQCVGNNCPWNAPLAFSVPGGTGGSFINNNPVPGNPNIGHSTNPGTGTGTLPAPGVGAGGGTVIINTNPPIPVVQPPEIVICEGTGVTCKCTGNRACTIKCEEADSCKESILDCPPGFDCTVVCMEKACTTVTINGPVSNNAAFTMNCPGLGSCVDAKVFADGAGDVAYTCSGKDSCKGATTINCGNGICEVACPGESACDGASILANSASSFQCSGYDRCPATFTPQPVPVPTEPPTVYVPCGGMPACPCTHTQCFTKRDPLEHCQCSCPTEVLIQEMSADPFICGRDATHQVYNSGACACDCPPNSQPAGGCLHGQTFNQNTCQCECPGGNICPGAAIMNLETCQCSCPAHAPTASDCSAVGKVLRNCQCDCPIPCAGPGQIQSPNTCACGCPFGTPTAAQCESGIIDELACACAAPLQSRFCCLTNVPGATEQFKPWAGRCWDEQTEDGCLAEPNARCKWDPNNCHSNPPVNTINPNIGCIFRDVDCHDNGQCCSEVCKVDGKCR